MVARVAGKSSSHTLIGSIIGVGIANAVDGAMPATGTSGVDWAQGRRRSFRALMLSVLMVGFIGAAGLMLLAMKGAGSQSPELCIVRPTGSMLPPPLWIRGLLILTCTGVSFAHGSNDGQKGMGLIMLILIGTVPTSYALNRALPDSHVASYVASSEAASKVIEGKAAGYSVIGDPRPAVTNYIARHELTEGTYPSLAVLVRDISKQIETYGSVAKIPSAAVGNTRNDMYLASEAVRFLMKDKESTLSAAELKTLNAYKGQLDQATKFIPLWVKISVAIALGLGTMIGWKRIVVTVGERDRQRRI